MEDLTLKESIRILLELAEQNVLTEEDVQGDPNLQEEKERQEQAIVNVRYNFHE